MRLSEKVTFRRCCPARSCMIPPHTAVPGNILTNDPNFKASAVMTKVFALLPPTNGGLTQNVTDHSLSSTTASLFDVKIDHAFSDKHRISGGFEIGRASCRKECRCWWEG